MMITSFSTYGLQRQSNRSKPSSKEATRSLRLHIEHTNSHDKTIQTRTFLEYLVNILLLTVDLLVLQSVIFAFLYYYHPAVYSF